MNNITPEQKNILENYRGIFIEINSKITQMIKPDLFHLMIENVNNLRNVAIISGAIASFAIYIYVSIQEGDNYFLIMGIVGLLLNIIFIIVYLNKTISRGVNSYNTLLDKETSVGNKGQKIIEEIYDKKLSLDEGFVKLEEVLNKINDKTKLRETNSHKKDYFANLTTIQFCISILFIILFFLI